MADHTSPCGPLQAVQAHIKNLHEWRQRQNSDLQYIRQRVDYMLWGMFVLTAGVVLNLIIK